LFSVVAFQGRIQEPGPKTNLVHSTVESVAQWGGDRAGSPPLNPPLVLTLIFHKVV